tara:strand:+ start:4911 stop:6083 length:1173 start_codon:yes stop_codon:yes gene_type:complete
MCLDIDERYHDTTVYSWGGEPTETWFIHAPTRGAVSFHNYRLSWNGGSPGGWTDWLNFTNQVNVSRVPNPVSTGFIAGGAGSAYMPSQGFFPKNHFMAPARITGFSGIGFRPFSQSLTQLAVVRYEWRATLNGNVISNDPEDVELPFGALNLPWFQPQPEGTTNADYNGEGLEFLIRMRFEVHPEITNIAMQINGSAPNSYNPGINVGYEFENGFIGEVDPSIAIVSDTDTDGPGWYTAAPDPAMPIFRHDRYWYNCGTVYYNGSLYFPSVNPSSGQISSGGYQTGFKPAGDNACPFGSPVYYTHAGVVEGTHPAWGYPENGPTTFHRHFRDRIRSLGDAIDYRRAIFSPNSRTIDLVPGWDATTVPYGSQEHGVNGVRRDGAQPVDPYV